MNGFSLAGILLLLALPAAADNNIDSSQLLSGDMAGPAALNIDKTTLSTWAPAPVSLPRAWILVDRTEQNLGGGADAAAQAAAVAARVQRLQLGRVGTGGGQKIFVTPEAPPPQVLQGFGKITRVKRR